MAAKDETWAGQSERVTLSSARPHPTTCQYSYYSTMQAMTQTQADVHRLQQFKSKKFGGGVLANLTVDGEKPAERERRRFCGGPFLSIASHCRLVLPP